MDRGFENAAEYVTVRDETRQDGATENKELELLEEDSALILLGDDEIPGKEMVKRMRSVSLFLS